MLKTTAVCLLKNCLFYQNILVFINIKLYKILIKKLPSTNYIDNISCIYKKKVYKLSFCSTPTRINKFREERNGSFNYICTFIYVIFFFFFGTRVLVKLVSSFYALISSIKLYNIFFIKCH